MSRMTRKAIGLGGLFLVAILLQAIAGGTRVNAQDSSLLYAPIPTQSPLTLENSSWTYVSLTPLSRVKLHDLITVIVDETSKVINKAEMEREKTGQFDAVLLDNPILRGFSLKPSLQLGGDPRLRGRLSADLEAEADFKSSGRITFSMAAKVVDIRPNGNLVIEGHRQVRNNDDVWERSITGIVRPDSIKEGNVVMAKDIAELRIYKRERGSVRDGYRRGWLLKAWDQIRLF